MSLKASYRSFEHSATRPIPRARSFEVSTRTSRRGPREIERQSLEMQASRAVRLGRGYLRLKQRLRLARRG